MRTTEAELIVERLRLGIPDAVKLADLSQSFPTLLRLEESS